MPNQNPYGRATTVRPRPTLASVFCLVGALALPACEERVVPDQVDPDLQLLVGAQAQRDMDILFVIDNSETMMPWQGVLQDQFAAMIAQLDQAEGGFPDVHIGVVTTDLQAGNQFAGGCSLAPGLAAEAMGRLQPMKPEDCALAGGECRFIQDIGDENCQDPNPENCRVRNYNDTLREALDSVISQLGTQGCRYTEPLEAMYTALANPPPDNVGFLRQNAALAVVIVTDADDCSLADQVLADPSHPPDSSFGPERFRCFEHGVQCNPDEPRAPGMKSGCVERASPYLHPTSRYVEMLQTFKGDDPVYVTVIAGPPGLEVDGTVQEGTVEVVIAPPPPEDPMGGGLMIVPTCSLDPMGPGARSADPAIRLNAMVQDLGETGRFVSMCSPEISSTLGDIASELNAAVQGTCLPDGLFDTDFDGTNGVQPNCEVIQSDAQGEIVTQIPDCENNPDNAPDCFRATVDPERCPDSDDHLKLTVERTTPPLPGAVVAMACDVSTPIEGYTKTSYYGCSAAPGQGRSGAPLALLSACALLLGWRRRATAT